MPLHSERLNDMADSIASRLDIAYIVSKTYNDALVYLDTNITAGNIASFFVTAPTNINISWGPASGHVLSNNNPTSGNALNYAVNQSKTANTVVFVKDNIIKGVMQLASPVVADGFGAGLYLKYFKITLEEV
jgi:hypothetical protein